MARFIPTEIQTAIDDLRFVINVLRTRSPRGPVSAPVAEDLIRNLTQSATRIRAFATVEGDAEAADIIGGWLEAHDAKERAEDRLAAFFWPKVRACNTEKEARDLMATLPGNAVTKAFFWDYLRYEAKIIPTEGKS